MFFGKSNGQGTIEYLVILAVIVVVSLIVVSLLINSTSGAEGISSGISKISGWTNTISVTETAVSPDGNYLVRLANNTGKPVTIKTVKIGDQEVNYSEDLFQGSQQNFKIISDVVCDVGQTIHGDLTVTYVTEYGLEHTETFPANVTFECNDYIVNLLANQCPEVGETCSGGSQSLSASSSTVAAGCYTATTLETVDSDLNESNIRSGKTVFGITGFLSYSSGQTTSYGAGPDDADKDGSSKSYTDNLDGTVTDNNTNLVWQKDHKDNCATLSWEDALSYCSTLANGVDGLTDGSSAGDWRVPSNVELITLADYSYPSGSYLNSVFTQTGWNSTCYRYWSSTTVPSDTSSAYSLSSSSGNIPIGFKADGDYYGVRCVRSE